MTGTVGMSIELTLWTEVDAANDAAEIFVRLNAQEFAGKASAWVKLAQLRQFANEIAQYPLAKDSRPSLAGGFWDPTGSHITQEHIYISAEPSGNLGALTLFVRLAVPDDSGDQSKTKYAASASIATEYAQLSDIAKGVTALANGSKQEVSFTFAEK
jgi:hypothetical protein